MKQIEQYILTLASQIPIELFVVIGSIIEDVIAPIPSPLVMTSAGSIALAQQSTWFRITWIILLSAAAKTATGVLFYRIADKAEDLILKRFGVFLGVSHKQVESIGKMFNGGWRDEAILLFLRSLPIMPTAPVSVIAGFIKIKMGMYIRATFIGSVIRNSFYFFVGYSGLAVFENILQSAKSLEQLVQYGIGIAIVLVIAGVWYTKKKEATIEFIEEKLSLKKSQG
jgi:membrane protein DedA with SNARE-associated domain